MLRRLLSFAKRVVKAAAKTIVEFFKNTANNIAGVALLAGSAIGFTKLAIEVPFYVQMPLWVESTMIAPVIGLLSVFILIHIMKWQLKLQGVSV